MRLWVGFGVMPVIATALCYMAVDYLVSSCVAAGLQVIRVGTKEASRLELYHYHLHEPTRQ